MGAHSCVIVGICARACVCVCEYFATDIQADKLLGAISLSQVASYSSTP